MENRDIRKIGAALRDDIIDLQKVKSFKPEKVETLEVLTKEITVEVGSSDTLVLTNWNIGYGGLGKEIDFFYVLVHIRPSISKYLWEVYPGMG